jgi:DNA-binding CsgD family transcriptional regulator
MSHSNAVRACEVRAVFRLVGECRELGDDAGRWWPHFLAGLGSLVGAGWGLGAEIGGCVHGPRRRDLGTSTWGWHNGFDQGAWLHMLQTFNHDPLYCPLINEYVARLPRAAGACFRRGEMIPDGDWYGSHYFETLQRPVGVDAILSCFSPLAGRFDEYAEVYLARAYGERDFSERDGAVVEEAFAAVGPLVGGPLARFTEPSPADLPPRARQVLRCLLEGDSDKQIGLRLGLLRHTVNQYAKRIFAHFGVGSRAELLARWVRRGWGGRFAWAEDFSPLEEDQERIGGRSHLRDRRPLKARG